jgi:hypothetical protein
MRLVLRAFEAKEAWIDTPDDEERSFKCGMCTFHGVDGLLWKAGLLLIQAP